MLTIEKPGIYKILNIITNDFYIGSTTQRIKVRWWSHKQLLNNGKHPNVHFINAWNKHGSENFTLEVLENIEGNKDQLREKEQYYIDALKPVYNKKKYAQLPIDYVHTNEIKNKFKNRKGIKRPIEFGQKISKALKGRIRSKEHCNNLSTALKNSEKIKIQTKKLHENSQKSINQYDKEMNFIKQWESITICCKELKIHSSQMEYHLKQLPYYKTVKGFIFRYAF